MIIFFRLQLSGDFTRHQAYSADYGATSDRAFVKTPLHFIRLAIKKKLVAFLTNKTSYAIVELFLKISIRNDSRNCI